MDTIPDLRWSSESSDTLDDFLAKKKPSMTQDDGTKPWIWVEKDGWEGGSSGNATTLEVGTDILAAVTERVAKIESDPNIPTRGSKAKGTRSKKDLREEAQADAAAQLKELSLASGYTCGKWLLFRDGSKIDGTFAALAKSLIDGPLSETAVGLMKVATLPKFDEEHYQHVICLYYPNVYDEPATKEILEVVATQHGIELSSVKSDLYTVLGIDSKHPSRMRSTIWQPKEVGIDNVKLKDLTKAYWDSQTPKTDDADAEDDGEGGASKRKQAPALSMEEFEASEAKAKKKKAAAAKKTFADDDSDSSSGSSSTKNKSKKKATTKKAPAPAAKPKASISKVVAKADLSGSETEPEPDD